MTAPIIEISLHPTEEQAAAFAFRELRAACGVVALATAEQAVWLSRGQDVAISALIGGADHPDRTSPGETNSIVEDSDVMHVPPTLIHNAVISQRASAARHPESAGVLAPVPLGGAAWLIHVTPIGVRLHGVPGIVRADLAPLWGTGGDDLAGRSMAQLTGAAWLDRSPGDHSWVLDVEVSSS